MFTGEDTEPMLLTTGLYSIRGSSGIFLRLRGCLARLLAEDGEDAVRDVQRVVGKVIAQELLQVTVECGDLRLTEGGGDAGAGADATSPGFMRIGYGKLE